MHDSPAQNCRLGNEGFGFQLLTHSVARSLGTVDAEVMNWYVAGTELRQRRSKEDLTKPYFTI